MRLSLKGGAGVSCSLLEIHTATLRELMEIECMVVIQVVRLLGITYKDNVNCEVLVVVCGAQCPYTTP